MADSQEQQVLATLNASAAMLGKLIHTLVVRGALSPADGGDVILHGRNALSVSGQSGELIDAALAGYTAAAAALSPAPRAPKRRPAP